MILRAPTQYVGKVARKEEIRATAETKVNSVMCQFFRLKMRTSMSSEITYTSLLLFL